MPILIYSFILITFLIWLLLLLSLKSQFFIKKISLIISLVQLLFIMLLWSTFNHLNFSSFDHFNFHFHSRWLDYLNFNIIIAIDNISVLFLLLTFLLNFICVLISWNSIKYRYSSFLITLLFINFILFNLFCAVDILFFYIFFESILIPMFILIGVWGSRQRKIHAVYQFFFYTLIGSLFMLLGLSVVYSSIQSTDLRILYSINFSFDRQLILWFSFFIAFCVKVPLFPFHIWLPEAHVEAPTIGSVILAGVLLKMGTYGLLRFVLPIFCDATFYFTPFVYTLCILGIIYTCCTTIRQVDLKKIIAYASVSHMSLVILGLFSNNIYGIAGSIFLMLSHGIVSSGLFFCIGCLYDRYKTRTLRYYSGLVLTMPLFSFCFFILILSNISFPGTSSFIGEFLILLGLFENNHFSAIVSVFSVILTAVYSIWLYNRIIFNKLDAGLIVNFSDFSKKELFIAITFCFTTILFGIKPASLISFMENFIYYFLEFK